jgi:uridine kinase
LPSHIPDIVTRSAGENVGIPQRDPFRRLIGICGGSGSGKTLVTHQIEETLGADRVLLIQQDSYYRDLSHLPFEERVKQNFDHPDAFDNKLLEKHLRELLAGHSVSKPLYDYANHTRASEHQTIESRQVIILEGILIFESVRLRNLMDIRVYVDADSDIRLSRRLRRDILERNRTVESVLEQYEQFVRPMHLEFVEPYKRYADIIIPQGGMNKVAIDLLITKVRSFLENRKN